MLRGLVGMVGIMGGIDGWEEGVMRMIGFFMCFLKIYYFFFVKFFLNFVYQSII